MKDRTVPFVIVAVVVYVILFTSSARMVAEQPEGLLINDVSRLNPTYVKEILEFEEEMALHEAVARARENNLKISIAGKRHSMGGHAFYKDAVVLDMTSYNKVLNVDPVNKEVTVQSGALWDDVIISINPHNLSVPVLQDYSTFSVGGSMSVNIHQSDPNYGPMIETIRSFRLLLADGSVLDVNREEYPELFSLVIGGYGLFGVILDVTIDLTDNNIYKKNEFVVDYTGYLEAFREIQETPEIENVFARYSIAKDDTLLRDVVVTTYGITEEANDAPYELVPDKNLALKKFIFGLSRKYDWGKQFRWYIQREHSTLAEPLYSTRNNLDYNDASFLIYHSSQNTDILQEYFFPVESLPEFTDKLRDVIDEYDVNLLSATIRYVPENNESFLSYSAKGGELFGIVLYFNVGLSEEEQEHVTVWTHELIDFTNEIGGTFYLPYELYATDEQIRESYPQIDAFFEKKLQYDPQELFMNEFYERYAP